MRPRRRPIHPGAGAASRAASAADSYVFEDADPPMLLRTTIGGCGGCFHRNCPEYRPPPSFVRSNAKPPPMKTERIAFGFVLVAWTVSWPLMPTCFHCAFVIRTTSGGGGVPGVTVTVTVAVLPNHVAVILTGVAAVTREVAMLNVLVERF